MCWDMYAADWETELGFVRLDETGAPVYEWEWVDEED